MFFHPPVADLLCRETYKPNTDPTYIVQKSAIIFVCTAEYRQPNRPTKSLSNLKTLNFRDLVDFKSAQMMYPVTHQKVPQSVQRLFQMKESAHTLRGTCPLKAPLTGTNTKY